MSVFTRRVKLQRQNIKPLTTSIKLIKRTKCCRMGCRLNKEGTNSNSCSPFQKHTHATKKGKEFTFSYSDTNFLNWCQGPNCSFWFLDDLKNRHCILCGLGVKIRQRMWAERITFIKMKWNILLLPINLALLIPWIVCSFSGI